MTYFGEMMRPFDARPFEERRQTAGEKLRVLFLSITDSRGGAAIASERLIRSLSANGEVEPLEIVSKKRGDNDWTLSMSEAHRFLPWKLSRKAIGAVNIVISDRYGFLPFEAHYLRMAVKAWKPHVIHLHNIHGSLGIVPTGVLADLAKAAPIVWTLHDMWVATGHCAYSLGCEKWRKGCGACPDLSLYPSAFFDRTRALAARKKAHLAAASPVLVAPSKWLTDLVSQAEVTRGLETRTIANGLDTSVFNPEGRAIMRQSLGIEDDLPVVMFAAERLSGDARKGAVHLRSALEKLQSRRSGARLDAILMGGDGEELLDGIPGIVPHPAGFIEDPLVAAQYYAASDLFLCTSVQDNLPNTLIEAAACGTAAISFDAGGCAETIERGVTGEVVPVGNSDAMASAVGNLVSNPHRMQAMGAAARNRAKVYFANTRMARDYLSLYRELQLQWPAKLDK